MNYLPKNFSEANRKLSLAIIVGMLFIWLWFSWTHFGNDRVEPSTKVLTGHDVALYNSDDSYVMGVVDSAFIVDNNSQFICGEPTTSHDHSIATSIKQKILSDDELGNEPAAFAILNAYRKLYCKNNS